MPNQHLKEITLRLKKACRTSSAKTSDVSECLQELMAAVSRPLPDLEIIDPLLSCLSYTLAKESTDIRTLLEKHIVVLIEQFDTDTNSQDVEEDLKDYLSVAIKNGYEKMVGSILKKDIVDLTQPLFNAKPTLFNAEPNKMPLNIATQYNQVTIAELLLEHHATIHDLTEALCHAAKNGFTKIVELLIALSTDVNARDIHGETPLDHAMANNHIDTAKLLVQHGATISNKTRKLHYAARNNHTEMITFLIELGADVNTGFVNGNGQTPLYCAITSGHIDAMGRLLLHGANVNAAQDNSGWFPLDVATRHNRADMVALLIAFGANIHEKDCFNGTLLIWAARYPANPDIIALLIENGATIDNDTKLSDAMRIFRLLSPSIGPDKDNIVRAIAERLSFIADELAVYAPQNHIAETAASPVTQELNQLHPILSINIEEELHQLLEMSLQQEDPEDPTTLTSPMKKAFCQTFYQRLIQFEYEFILTPLRASNLANWATLFSPQATNTTPPATSQMPTPTT